MFREPKAEYVTPEMKFEGALREVAAEKKLTLVQARASLREFVTRVRAAQGEEFLDPALASFLEHDYADAERLAGAATQAEPASGAQLLQVIADSGNALREAGARQRMALRLSGEARMMQSKFWEAETSYRAAGPLVSKTDAPRWIEAQWRVTQANGHRGCTMSSCAPRGVSSTRGKAVTPRPGPCSPTPWI